MSSKDDDDAAARRIADTINQFQQPRRVSLPWTETELYEKAFGGDTDTFPLGLEGKPIACDSVFDNGERVAAMAILGVALTEDLSPASRATLRHFYDAVNPDAKRGRHKLTLKRRARGVKSLNTAEQVQQALADSMTATLVRFAKQKYGNTEAAVNHVANLRKVSRAEIFRALARNKAFAKEVDGD